MRSPFYHLYEQHASEVAHLWGLWFGATMQPQYNPLRLAELEKRVFNHIAGLMHKPDWGWQACLDNLEFMAEGEVFAATQVAFRSYNTERIKYVVDTALASPPLYLGLLTALTWLPADICHPWLKKFFESKNLQHKLLALDACLFRNEDPGHYLMTMAKRADCVNDINLLQSIWKCVGNFKRKDVYELAELAKPENCFYSIRADILLGNEVPVDALRPFVFDNSEYREEATELAFRTLPQAQARNWISELAQSPGQKPWVIKATATLGDPRALGWLVNQMQEPIVARLAGYAFTQMTGVDIAAGLEASSPYSLEQQLELDDIAMDEQEFLPWPNAQAIEAFVNANANKHLAAGERYCWGRKISKQDLQTLYDQGTQPARRAANYELALMGAMPLLNLRKLHGKPM